MGLALVIFSKTSVITALQINMVQKRPLDDEQIFISFKHPRQVGHSKELVSFSESVFATDVSKPPTLGEGL